MLALDCHCHLLPGADDGARTPAETLAMARFLADLGVTRVYATPHQFRFGNTFTVDDVAARVAEVRTLLAGDGIELDVQPGAEHAHGEAFLGACESGERLIPLRLDGGDALLVELSMNQPTVGVRELAGFLRERGFRPVLAHPERYAKFADIARVRGWAEAGWDLQLNLLSLVGAHGPRARRLATRLVEEGRYALAGSDLHRAEELPLLEQAHTTFRALCPTEVSA